MSRVVTACSKPEDSVLNTLNVVVEGTNQVANKAVFPSSMSGYAQKSVFAGETIDFRVSSPTAYNMTVESLGWNVDGPSTDTVLHEFGPNEVWLPTDGNRNQPIYPGSYIHVQKSFPATTPIDALTLECWVRPYDLDWQGLITQYSVTESCGFGLFIAAGGAPALYFGTGGNFEASWLVVGAAGTLVRRQWHHVVAVFAGGDVGSYGSAKLYVDGVLQRVQGNLVRQVIPGPAPLRIGAYGSAGATQQFMSGDIAMPVIYSRALSDAEVSARSLVRTPQVPAGSAVEGCWPLTEEAGALVADVSPASRDGVIQNRGTWMIGGPGFRAESVDRFGDYDPLTDTTRGHALRLSATDLYDCGWSISHSWTLPARLPPGIYVGRMTSEDGTRYDIPFVVRRSRGLPAAPVMVVCNVNTWLAYNVPFGLHGIYKKHPGSTPEGSIPTFFAGTEMPWSGEVDTYALYIPALQYSHLVRAERQMHTWLEQNGYTYDVISDTDLVSDDNAIGDARVVVVCGHSEYWSAEMFDALNRHVEQKKNIICASGNTGFWRVSLKDGVMECRKLPPNVAVDVAEVSVGEIFHEHDKKRGGWLRETGRSAWQVVALECSGFSAETQAPFVVTADDHEFFATPERIGLTNAQSIGGALGVFHEWDATLGAISDGPPIPLDYNPVALAQATGSGGRFNYRAEAETSASGVISEIVDWKREGKGRIFSIGSIGVGAALSADPNLATLVRNALHHQGVVAKRAQVATLADGSLLVRRFDGLSWSEWIRAFGGMLSVRLVEESPGRLGVVGISLAGELVWQRLDTGPSGRVILGTGFVGRPAVASWGRSCVTVLARRADGSVSETTWNGETWSPLSNLGGAFADDVSIGVIARNLLFVAGLTVGGEVWVRTAERGAFAAPGSVWGNVGGGFAFAPTVFVWGGSHMTLFAVRTTGELYASYRSPKAITPFGTWSNLGGKLSSPVVGSNWGPQTFNLFSVNGDGGVSTQYYNGSWPGWVPIGGSFRWPLSAVSFRGKGFSVVGVTTAGGVAEQSWNGVAWSGWVDGGVASVTSVDTVAFIG